MHEPGSTELGSFLRSLLKSKVPITAYAELLLFEAARAELISRVISPSLRSGAIVIADRFIDSTLAYQGYGRRIPIEYIQAINRIATQGILPELTFLIDVPVEIALQRVGPVQLHLPFDASEDPNVRWETEGQRFEDEDFNFHQRIRNGYHKLVQQSPERWVILDGTRGVQDIAAEIWLEVSARLHSKERERASATSIASEPLIGFQ